LTIVAAIFILSQWNVITKHEEMEVKYLKNLSRNEKAVSPVIATIIIVAIAIVMSIGVAYWMLSLGGAFTRFEKLEFTSGYATVNNSTGNFDVKMVIKNTGSADATLDLLFLNGKPSADYGATVALPSNYKGFALVPGGETGSMTITLTKGNTWKSGMSVELTVQTSAGRQYPKTVILP